jgi:ferredoxin
MYEAQDGNPSGEFLKDASAYMRTPDYGKSFIAVNPPQMRTIPINKSITMDHHAATYDRIRELVKSSKGPFAVLKCICRESRKMGGDSCKITSRLETCLGMGDMAAMVLRRGHGREITADEALVILSQNEADGLVLQPANEQNAEFVCSCCGCCCGMLQFQKMLPRPVDFWASNFYAEAADNLCARCSKCVSRCQVNAMSMNGPGGTAKADLDKCIGCGLCVPSCPSKAIRLVKKVLETVPPENEEELFDMIKANKRSGFMILFLILKGVISRMTKRLFHPEFRIS